MNLFDSDPFFSNVMQDISQLGINLDYREDIVWSQFDFLSSRNVLARKQTPLPGEVLIFFRY